MGCLPDAYLICSHGRHYMGAGGSHSAWEDDRDASHHHPRSAEDPLCYHKSANRDRGRCHSSMSNIEMMVLYSNGIVSI